VSLLLSFCFFPAPPAEAQSGTPVVLSMGTHSLTTPWYLGPVADRINPAFMVGTDRSIRTRDKWRFFYALNLGLFRHHWWMTGLSLEPELGIGRSIPGGFHADLRLGLGYLHYFWRRETLELKDGQYVKAADWGHPSLIVPLSLTLQYRGGSTDPLSVSPFVSARWAGQGLFLDEIPAMTHLFLLGGVRIERGQHGSPEGRS
jgi:hypothetical protein